MMKTPTRRRGARGMDSVKAFAASCLFVFAMGNLLMLQSYRSLVAPRPDDGNLLTSEARLRRDAGVREVRDVVAIYGDEFLPRIATRQGGESYSVIEGRVRRLMQDGDKDVDSGLVFGPSAVRDIPPRFRQLTSDVQLMTSEGKDLLDCADVEEIQNMRYIGGGWTKAVYRGDLRGESVAVKTVDVGGRDVNSCLKNGGNITWCYSKAARKIIKEIVLLQALAGENVLKVRGFCVPTKPFDGDVDSTVAMVTELGEPIDQIKLLQMSWEDRLKVSYDVMKLVEWLSRTPYGSLALNDFRRTQFVLINGTLKLSDVDDAGWGEPRCAGDQDCRFQNVGPNTTTRLGLGCFKGYCKNHNEFHNIIKTAHHFTSFLLPHGAPKTLRPLIDNLIDNFEKMKVNSKELLKEITYIVKLYKFGSYLNRGPQNTDYQASLLHDLPGQFDYRCRFSMSGGACTLSVFDLREAQEICDSDHECQGFVWTRRKTWTGRTLIHLKNGKGTPSPNTATDLYIKPS